MGSDADRYICIYMYVYIYMYICMYLCMCMCIEYVKMPRRQHPNPESQLSLKREMEMLVKSEIVASYMSYSLKSCIWGIQRIIWGTIRFIKGDARSVDCGSHQNPGWICPHCDEPNKGERTVCNSHLSQRCGSILRGSFHK